MRYLFGDLTEFPRQENTLELLRRFFDMAVEVLNLDHSVGRHLVSIEEDRTFVSETLEDIEEFHGLVRTAIEQAVSERAPEDVVAVLANGALVQFGRYVSDGKNRVVARVEQRIRETEAEIGRLQQRSLAALRVFFVDSGMPLQGNALRVELDGETYRASAEILDVIGLRCVYRLNAGACEFFAAPRRFGDLLPGRVEFPIGTRKAWLKKDPVLETMRLDDALLRWLVDAEDFTEVALARRGGTAGEVLVLRQNRGSGSGARPRLEASRLDESGVRSTVPAEVIDPAALSLTEEFFRGLRPSILELYKARGELINITIEGKDVVAQRRLQDLVSRMVSFLAPTIREIDRRSPARSELCLKVEHEGSRREEIFIPKRDLQRKVDTLPPTLQTVFAPLGLTASAAAIEPAIDLAKVPSIGEEPTDRSGKPPRGAKPESE